MNYTHIVHFSDIHIHKGPKRYDEYKGVFQNMNQYLEGLECIRQETAMIVVTGDVFHDKGNIDPYGIDLFQRFVNILSRHAPTIFIEGNHDLRQDALTSAQDASGILDVLLKPYTTAEEEPRVFYLKETGVYECGNVNFGLLSIRDVLERGNTTGLAKDIPTMPTPPPKTQHDVYNVALCHIAIEEVSFSFKNNRYSNPSSEHFKEYDMTLLGDIHKRQWRSGSNGVWGYAGSLVQQNFGESLFHGGLLWDLSSKTCRPFDIFNTHCFLTLQKNGDEYMIDSTTVLNKNWLSASEFDIFDIRVKCHKNGFGTKVREDIQTLFEEANKRIASLNEHMTANDDVLFLPAPAFLNDDISGEIGFDMTDPLKHQQIFEKYLDERMCDRGDETKEFAKSFLTHPQTFVPNLDDMSALSISPEKKETLSSKAQSIVSIEDNPSSNNIQCKNFTMKSLSWDWLYSYGKSNRIDFTSHRKNIVLLKGLNASGKSNFLDIILLSLYGQNIPSRSNMHYTAHCIIHTKKPPTEDASSSIVFCLEGVEYTLQRKYKTTKNSSSLNMDVVLTRIGEDSFVLKQGAVKKWLQENIGTLQDLLASSFITQNNDGDFFMMRESERTEYLEKSLNLDFISTWVDRVKNMQNIYKQLSMIAETELEMTKERMKKNETKNTCGLMDLSKFDVQGKTREHIELTARKKECQCKTEEYVSMLNQQVVSNKKVCELLPDEKVQNLHQQKKELDINLVTKMDELKKYAKFINENRIHLQEVGTYSQPPPSFSYEYYTELKKKYIQQRNHLGASVPIITKKSMEDVEKEIANLEKTHRELISNRPRSARYTQENIDRFHREYQEKCITTKSRWEIFMTQEDEIKKAEECVRYIKDHEKLLRKAATLDIPHDPNCWACALRPDVIHQKMLREEIQEMQKTLKEVEEFVPHIDHLQEYYSWKKEYDALMTKHPIMEEEQEILTHNVSWQKEYDVIYDNISTLKNYRLNLQYFITEKEFEEKTTILQEYVSCLVSQKDRDTAQSAIIQEALYGHYNHMYLKEKQEMENIVDTMTTLQMELQRHHEYKKQRDELEGRIDILTKLCEKYTKYQTSLSDMYDVLVGTRENPFGIKEWIQRENIIPYLVDRINPMLKYFGMTMEIECIKGRYDFFVKDVATGMSMIHERASGFQKTIVNLAMRTTLLNMNPSKIRMGQMFIDEGFTSCDSENIKHMPVLIRYFLNFYENIFLVSHQDDVQETADVVVNVVKKDGISFFEDVVKTCL